MQRILITGGGGVVGKALQDRLHDRDCHVVTINGRSDCNLESSTETNALFKFVKPTHVFHIAGAIFGVGGNMAFPGDAFRRNTLMNVNVVEASRLAGVEKIVAMGSAAMYADGLTQPMRESDAMTGEPHGSEYAYAYSKRALLVQLRSYATQYGLKYAFVVATNMYGPHDRFNVDHGHVIPSLLMKFEFALANRTAVSVWGDGSPTRDFLFSSDAAAGLELLMEKGDGVYNLATGRSQTIAELVHSIAGHYPAVRWDWDINKPLGQLSRQYDVSRISTLGFEAKTDLKEGIAATIAWLRENIRHVRT